jgi:hypothetical protein
MVSNLRIALIGAAAPALFAPAGALATDGVLAGRWRAELIFTDGPSKGNHESVRLTLLADGVTAPAEEIRAEDWRRLRGFGKRAANDDRLSCWFNAVFDDRTGDPEHVVYVHPDGTLAPDGHAFTASGESEPYANRGELLATNHVDLSPTRKMS